MRGDRAIDPIFKIRRRKKETIHEEVPALGPRACSCTRFHGAGHRRDERGRGPDGKASSSSSPPSSSLLPPSSLPSSPPPREEDGKEDLLSIPTVNEKTGLGFLFKAGLLLVMHRRSDIKPGLSSFAGRSCWPRTFDANSDTATRREIFHAALNRDTARNVAERCIALDRAFTNRVRYPR